MADDAALERFLTDAAPLRAAGSFDPSLAFHVLSAAAFDGDDQLIPRVAEALNANAVAMAAPTARNTAIARYALERAAIAVEGRLLAAPDVGVLSLTREAR